MRCRPSLVRGRAAQVNPGGFTTPARRPSVPHRTAGCGKSSLRPLMAGSSPSLPDGSNPSAAIVQSASDVQCSRLLKTTPGMPAGSPGMEVDGVQHAYQVIGLTKTGSDQVVAEYPAQ
ncbi:transposase [Ectopseudomonas oleovorans]|uniref:Transposase n=1 Tax=Ectopseudomonas oleovorans TaxID=301 RepID=A0A427HM16_ECTOL|nr:transposase [Pseudomonas oleovorans]